MIDSDEISSLYISSGGFEDIPMTELHIIAALQLVILGWLVAIIAIIGEASWSFCNNRNNQQ